MRLTHRFTVPSSDVECVSYLPSSLFVIIYNSSRYYAQPQPAPLDHTQSSPHLTAPHSDTNQVTGVPHLQNLPLDAVGATIQEERDVQWIHQWIKGRHWLKVNTHEPLVGSQDSSPLVDEYGIRGFSCYSSLVERKDDGTFGCRRERCVHFSARSMEGAITHQRTHHYNHKPYKCSDVTGVRW